MATDGLPVCTHCDNMAALGPGDTCYVRWLDGGCKRWYRCRVIQSLRGRCIVALAEGADSSVEHYEVSWEMDEALARPSFAAVEFICRHPGAVCIEVNRTKYLVPDGTLFFSDAIGEVMRRAGYSKPVIGRNASVDAVASTYEFDKIVL